MDPHGRNLQAIGRLAAGIAHEINTPTQFVGDTVGFLRHAFEDLLSLQDLQRELREAAEIGNVTPELLARVRAAEAAADVEYLRERVPRAFERAEEGLGRVGAVVGAMRELALPPAAEKAPADLNEALRTTLVAATNAYKYVADVATDLGELPRVVCHAADLHHVFLSLIVNAAEAVERSGERGTIRIRSRAHQDHVLITVADTGHGIGADVADRVFDGCSLAIARAVVVERHAGTLTFETLPGEGTTFHVRLPIGHAVAEEIAA
jgi:two-component system, NtrC family, sensor kinase